jgi:F420-0:gamma-glutamyl ligase-like protein
VRRDFDRINEILASLMTAITHDIAEVSPWIGLLNRIGGRHDDEIVRFSIEVARSEAWRFAAELAPIARDHWP